MEKKYEIHLHDIKPLVEIEDHSMIFLIALVVLAVFIIVVAIYFLIRYLKYRNRITDKKIAFEKLHNIDFSSSKTAAYEITKYGRYFLEDERHKEQYDSLISRLEKYKYKKDTSSFEEEDKNYFNVFLGMIDV